MVDFKQLVNKFKIEGNFISSEKYGCGHINTTYLVITDKKRYILQKINNSLFTNVEGLMNNISLVTNHIANKALKQGLNPEKETLTIIPTLDNKTYVEYEDGYYRLYLFIEDTIVYQTVSNAQDFYQSAVAFGRFQNLLSDFDSTSLFDVIPNFHNTPSRLVTFKETIEKDPVNRASSVQDEINFVLSRENYADRIVKLLENGQMPYRVTHNDTKLNNVLLDAKTGNASAVIDLDTVMNGSMCYDFGDSIRFGCNAASEDEKDLTKVVFRIDLFEEYVKGYLSELKDSMTKIEADNLAFSAILMTYECGMRFLQDHINGDKYFHITRENHNLDRCRTQFKLIEQMEKSYKDMCDIVNKYYN